MAKKMVPALVLAMVLAGGVFAQDADGAAAAAPAGERGKFAAALDTVPLFKGFMSTEEDVLNAFGIALDAEYGIVSNYSIGLRLELLTGKPDISGAKSETYFAVLAKGRWYPLSTTLEKYFLEAGLGFNTDGVEDADDALFTGLIFALKTGWKHQFTPLIFAEPAVGFVLSKSGAMFIPTPLGWQIGFNLGMAF